MGACGPAIAYPCRVIRRRALLVGLLAAALTAGASPAQAMTPPSSGWSPYDRPLTPDVLARELESVLFTVSCGGLTATGWSADAVDDTAGEWDSVLITTPEVGRACMTTTPIVVQGSTPFSAKGFNADRAAGLVLLSGDLPYIDWDFVPMPRVNQWVAIAARSASGVPLPMLERRITQVGDDTFTVDAPIEADYVGAPVVDNLGRSLGILNAPGAEITGSPQYCASLFICTDPARVWWDITAPSGVRKAKAVGGKRSVTVTWKAAASDGGAEVAYWYRVGTGDWEYAETFRVTVKARTGTLVSVTIGTVNAAGPGPMVTVAARAK